MPAGAKHPLQFGREVACRLLGVPERIEWKKCVTDAAAEEAAAKAVREEFAPHDFTATL